MATESVAVGVGSGRCRGEGRPSKRWWAKPPTFWKGIRGFLLIRGGSLCCLMFCRLATEVWVPVSCRLPSGASLGPQHDSYLLAHGVGRRGARTAKLIYSATEPPIHDAVFFVLAVATRSSCERSGVVCRALVAAQPGADPPRSQTADLKAEKPTPARKSGTPSLPKTITCRLPSGARLQNPVGQKRLTKHIQLTAISPFPLCR